MKHLVKTAALLGAAALIATAGSASATGGSVWVGSSNSGDHAFTGDTGVSAAPYAVFFAVRGVTSALPWDQVGAPSDDVLMGCTRGRASGEVHAGAVTGKIATIDNTIWGNKGGGTSPANCVGPGGIDMDVDHIGDWELHATNPNNPPKGKWTVGLTDEAAGYIDNIEAWVYSKTPGLPDGYLCEMTVEGKAKGQFREPVSGGTQELEVDQKFDGDLEVTAVTGCLGMVLAGKPAWFQGVYDVSSTSGAIDLRP